MLLEHLTSQDLGEEVSWVGLARHVVHLHNTGTAQLAHLEQLTLHVPRVLRCGEPVAQVVSGLTVGVNKRPQRQGWRARES